MSNGVLGVDPSKVDSSPEFAVGTQATLPGGKVYEYVKATGSITQYHVVAIDEAGEVAAGYGYDSSAIPVRLGIAQAALTSGKYGWVARKGMGLTVKAITGSTADGKVYTSATAGAVGSSSSTQSLIQGLRLDAANASGSTANTACSAITELCSSCA